MSLLSRLGSVLERIQLTSRPLTTFNHRLQHHDATSNETSAETGSSSQYTRSDFINKQRFVFLRRKNENADMTFSNHNAKMLLNFLGSRMALETADERRTLANDVFKRCLDRDASLYSNFLRTHLDNRSRLSTAEVLQEMQSNGVDPDQSVYVRLLGINCQQGDLESAHHIMRFMKNQGMSIPSAVYGYLASCHCIKGETKRGREIVDYMHKNNVAITPEVVHLLCGGLIEAREKDELVNFLTFYAQVKPLAKLNRYGVIDLMAKLMEAEYYDVLPRIYRLASPDTIDVELALLTLQKYPGNGRYVLDLLNHLKIQLPYGNSECYFIQAAFDRETSQSFKTVEEWREYLDAVDAVVPAAKHHMITEALREVCHVNPQMCFETLRKMKELGVEIKQHMLIPVSLSSPDNAANLERFCKDNDIGYNRYYITPFHAAEIMKRFSREDTSDPEVLRSFVDATFNVCGLSVSHMVNCLMKMSNAKNFSTVFFDSLINQFNDHANPFARYRFWQVLLDQMRSNGFSGKVNEKVAVAKLKRSHQVLLPLLKATTAENVKNIKFEYFASRIFPSYIAMVREKSFDFSKFEDAKLPLKIIMDIPLHMEKEEITKSFDSVPRHELNTEFANVMLWHYVEEGETEKAAKLYKEKLADLPPLCLVNFIPPQLLGEKSLAALKSYLGSIHGSNTADWVIYLSYLTNGMMNEAAAFYRADMELTEEVSNVLQASAHLNRIPSTLKQLFKLKDKASLLEVLDIDAILQRLLLLGDLDLTEELFTWAHKEEIKLDTKIKKTAFNTLVKNGRDPQFTQNPSEEIAIKLVKGKNLLATLKQAVLENNHISRSLCERVFIDLAGTADFDEGVQSWKRSNSPFDSVAVVQARLQYYLNNGDVENAIKWVRARATPNQIMNVLKRREIYSALGKYFRENGADISLLENSALEDEFVQHEVELFTFVKGESNKTLSFRICKTLGKLTAEGQVDFDRVLKATMGSNQASKMTEIALGLFESRSPLFERCLEEMAKNNICTFKLQTSLVDSLRNQAIDDWNIAQLEMLYDRFPPLENGKLKIATDRLFNVIQRNYPRIMTQDCRDQLLQLMNASVRHLPTFMHFSDVQTSYLMLQNNVKFSGVLTIDHLKERVVNQSALDEASLNMLFGN